MSNAPWGEGDRPTPPETMLALRELVRVAQRTPAVVARRAGLSHSELQVLELLSDGATSPAELSRVVGVTSAAMSGIVDRLVARGHASRAPHPADGRRTVVDISDSGRAEAIGHLSPMLAELAAVDAAMTDEEREAVVRFLTAATRAIRQLEGP
ncbi:MarR family winged helix-turn-helix transcriptional regulator [Janibacter sp. GXQ6167]|uniref:MarR family winged helix-turn-helix transcriptional regulator n=1 Tax=Janibacter sp. GXQ6167 TaxID=3240791 RepID=UPI0035240A85